MAYGTAARGREFSRAITTDVIDDTPFETLMGNKADPIIDAALSDMGAPFTEAPALIKDLSALYGCVIVFRDAFYQVSGSKWADKSEETFWKLLNKIQSGKLSPGGECLDAELFQVSAADQDRPTTEIYTSANELNWKSRGEVRES